MPKIITIIPEQTRLERKTKVAAYARVSSGKDAMLHSLSAQVSHYSKYMQDHDGWLYVGVYADEATTGTKENRDEFQRLLTDCRSGKVDSIITKSISRFARNTVMLLQTVRELRAFGVDVYFEEQNIHTISAEGEFMLTILASYAQEESLSASENQKWRIKKNFEEGKPWNGTMLGYRYDNGCYVIVPEEAELVKRIFTYFLSGIGCAGIAKRLNEEGYLTRCGNPWYHSTVMKVLRNYTYTGNLLLQKTYRENHITKRTLINHGELPRYHAENTHEPIINMEQFETVQAEIAVRAAKFSHAKSKKQTYPFSGLMVCDGCGKNYRRKITRTGAVWVCATFNTLGKEACAAKQIPEDTRPKAGASALGPNANEVEVLCASIAEKRGCKDNILIFRCKDGTEISQRWQDRSRSESWTDEMKATARQRALDRRKN